MKQQSMAMPMASAGILSASSDMKIAGIEIDPRYIIAFAVVFAIVVKFASLFLSSV